MGCNGSKTRDNEPVSPQEPASPKNNGQDVARNVEHFFKVALGEASTYLGKSDVTDSLKSTMALILANTSVDVVHQHYRMKSDVALSSLRKVVKENNMKVFIDISSDVEEHVSDDGLSRLLLAYLEKNKTHEATMSVELAGSILGAIDIAPSPIKKSGSFCDLLEAFYGYHASPALDCIFKQFSNDEGTVMDAESYRRFLAEVQGTEVSVNDAEEKIRSRFGGALTIYSFRTYIFESHSNSALDPQRSRDVWQDMMQPLPQYMIRTQTVVSQAQVDSALTQGVRAFVLECSERDHDIYTGSMQLRAVLDLLKAKAFVNNDYPVVLCLSPTHDIDKLLQEKVAMICTEVLGDRMAKGMMFDGANINDPQYSPAALQKKFLVMGTQGPLKPFVGFLVADMAREGLGVRVTDVQDGTPAAKAGICKDDWLTHINGNAIKDKMHLKQHLVTLQLGEEFTIRKENLDEVKVVVGGTVDKSDVMTSKELSDLIFLKFSHNDVEKQAPWETFKTTAKEMEVSPHRRHDLQKALVYLTDTTEESTKEEISQASDQGIQFIDGTSSVLIHSWAMGKFAENAHCGFVLKSTSGDVSPFNLHIDVLEAPLHIRGAKLEAVSGICIGNGKVTLGEGVDVESASDQDVIIIEATFSADGANHTFVSSFPSHILRNGYRALPCTYKNEIVEESLDTPYDLLISVKPK